MVDPDDEWKEVERGDLGLLTLDSGESHTLMMGDLLSLLSTSSTLICSGIMFLDSDNITQNLSTVQLNL